MQLRYCLFEGWVSQASPILNSRPPTKRVHRLCLMWQLLLLLLLASSGCAVATRPVNIDDDAEWGIFAALRSAHSASERQGPEASLATMPSDVSCHECNCCHDVQDLKKRVAAMEHEIAHLSGKVSMPSAASPCPSIPAVAAASLAAADAAPALAHMQASYCNEWVRL